MSVTLYVVCLFSLCGLQKRDAEPKEKAAKKPRKAGKEKGPPIRPLTGYIQFTISKRAEVKEADPSECFTFMIEVAKRDCSSLDIRAETFRSHLVRPLIGYIQSASTFQFSVAVCSGDGPGTAVH